MSLVIVIRQAYQDCPEFVIAMRPDQQTEDVIRSVYGDVTFDMGGFDTQDGRSMLYDVMGVLAPKSAKMQLDQMG